MNIKELLISAKAELEEKQKLVTKLENELLSGLGVKKGDLILHKSNYYYVRHLRLDNDLRPYISLREIRNQRVNWESISTTRLYVGEFEKVEWEFDQEKLEDLSEQYGESDSVSDREDLAEEISNMFLSCKHKWKYDFVEDEYICGCCGAITEKEITNDWLNGETESHNIDLEQTLSEWI